MVTMEGLMDILVLDRQGYSVPGIARKLGIHRKTVRKYLEAGGAPVYRKQKRKASILDAFRPAIREWLAQASYRATWVYDRLRSLGYTGSYETVKGYVRGSRNRPVSWPMFGSRRFPGNRLRWIGRILRWRSRTGRA